MMQKCMEISGVGDRIISGILAEMGDISRFDDVKEIRKYGSITIIAKQRINSLYKAEKEDDFKNILIFSYSVQDTMTVHHFSFLL